MAKEAAELASASFGEVMLHTVGSVYEAQAQIFLGGLINGSIAALKARGHSLKSQVCRRDVPTCYVLSAEVVLRGEPWSPRDRGTRQVAGSIFLA